MQGKRLFLATCTMLLLSNHGQAITIDGQLDEKEWQNAETISSFTTVEPFSLNEPEYTTKAHIFTNEQGIYLGIINSQAKNTQHTQKLQRDSEIQGDRNRVIIDFDNNQLSAYGFELGNGGTMRDGIWSNEKDFSADWDGNWQAATRSNDKHWVSEFFIPWDIAPMAKAKGDKRDIGLFISRQVAHIAKTFANTPADNDRSRFLSDIKSHEIDNFSASSFKAFVSATAQSDLLNDENEGDLSLELFWQPDASKQLSLALNPDFGQIESDNLVVNFSPNETFFNEKRPFFTENQSLFDIRGRHNLRVIHTRRIGGPTDTGTGEGADIDAAAKFTSNGKQFNYGFMAVTESDTNDAQGRDFFSARARHTIGQATLGYMATYVERPELDRRAQSHTLDYDIAPNNKLKISGSLTHADVSGLNNIASDKVDLGDYAFYSKFEYQNSQKLRQRLELVRYGDEFEINDMGFLSRNNLNAAYYFFDWQKPAQKESNILKNMGRRLWIDYEENQEGDRLNNALALQHYWQFKNTSSLYLNANYYGKAYDDRLTRGNNILEKSDGYRLQYYFGGKKRKKVQYHHEVEFIDRAVDGRGLKLHFHPTYYINDKISTVLSLNYLKRDRWLLWQEGNRVNTFTREQFDTSFDLNAQLTEKQELRLKFQWISLSAEGDESYSVTENGQLRDEHSVPDDFSLSDTALQIRYRYELGPLSNIFLVYSRGGRYNSNEDRDVFGSFFDGWDERTGDNILLKVRYLL